MSEQFAEYGRASGPYQGDTESTPLVLRCQASFSGECLARTDGYGFECPSGECRLADDEEAYVADLMASLAERMRVLVEGEGCDHGDGSEGA